MASSHPDPTTSRHVAVIGAGAAGLVAARELRREGHSVVVLERGNQIGGVWAYTSQVEPDPLSLDPTRPVVHSSVYRSLRTNIPRECMGFTDFPFASRPVHDGSRDPRRHPGHSEVLAYLRDFAKEFDIEEMIRFETEVVKAEPAMAEEERGKWRVESRNSDGVADEIYDAVLVCNGHYTEPRHALITGIDSWPGKQIHSHNYRVPDPFKDEVVIVIGSSASGIDICRDIAKVAKEVHVSSRSTSPETYEKLPCYDNLWLHPTIESAHEDGSVVFKNGQTVYADTIMHCTGYKYYFPFLDTKGEVTVDDNRVGPLYKHVFPPALAPGLSFIGLPWQITPFPMFELQSKWVAAVLSGRVSLPSQDEMMEDTKAFYDKLEASGIPKRYTHLMPDDSQKGRCKTLAAGFSFTPLPAVNFSLRRSIPRIRASASSSSSPSSSSLEAGENNELDAVSAFSEIVPDTVVFDDFERFPPTAATVSSALLLGICGLPETIFRNAVDMALADFSCAGLETTESRLSCFFNKAMVNVGGDLVKLVPGRVSTEVDARLAYDTNGIVRKVHDLLRLYNEIDVPHDRLLFKIPATWQGIEAARLLESEGIQTHITFVYSFAQAAAAAQAGASVIQIFVGRLRDWARNHSGDTEIEDAIKSGEDPGLALVKRSYNYIHKYGYKSKLMAAAVRNKQDLFSLLGVDYVIAPLKVLQSLKDSPANPDDEKYSFVRKLTPETATHYNFTNKELIKWDQLSLASAMGPASVELLSAGVEGYANQAKRVEELFGKIWPPPNV